MGKRYLVGPFLAVLAPWIIGNGTISLIPLYAVERGASSAGIGALLAFAFACLTLGNFAPGILPRFFSRRRAIMVGAGAMTVLVLLLTSRTTSLLGLMACYGGALFLFGIVGTQATILVGLAAPEKERGTAFGILGMTNGLGGLIGGFGAGWLAERFGFAALWEGAAAVSLLVIAGALLSTEPGSRRAATGGAEAGGTETTEPAPAAAAAPAAAGRAQGLLPSGSAAVMSAGFVLLLAANLVLAFTNATGNLGRSLVMNEHGFSKLTIDLTQSVTGVVGLCVTLFLGWLSDKVGRRWIMVAAFLLSAAGLVVLSVSRLPWQFYMFAGLIAFVSVPGAVGPAYVVDVVSREGTARGVAVFQGMFWAGNIAGLVLLGLAFERLGTAQSVLYSALLTAAGIVFLLLIRRRPARPQMESSAPANLRNIEE